MTKFKNQCELEGSKNVKNQKSRNIKREIFSLDLVIYFLIYFKLRDNTGKFNMKFSWLFSNFKNSRKSNINFSDSYDPL